MPTNPLEDYEQTKEAAKVQRKEQELAHWQKWKDNGQKPTHLEPLLKMYESNFNQKSRMWRSPTVPEPAFKAKLQELAIKAFQTFDPTRGAALNTHVENQLKKAHRFNAQYQNLAAVPEGQAELITGVNSALETLREDLGREPTHSEIAAHLRTLPQRKYKYVTPKRVGVVMQAIDRKAVPMGRSAGEESYDYASGNEGTPEHAFEEQQISVAKNILPDIFPNKPELHVVFDHTFGTNGKQKLTTGQLAKKLNKNDAQISRMKTTIGNTLRQYMGLDKDEED